MSGARLRRTELRLARLFQALALSPVVASGLVAACGSGKTDAPAAQTDATTTTPPPPAADAPSDAGDAATDASYWCEAGKPRDITAADASCAFYNHLPCGLPPGAQVGVYGDIADCNPLCSGFFVFKCLLIDPSDAGGLDGAVKELPDSGAVVECEVCPGAGRRPAGYRAARKATPLRGPRAFTARYFADMTRLEAASIVAFEALACELDAHGAPASLTRAACRAARDETRHARAMSAFAEREGVRTRRPRVRRRAIRPLASIALENGVEGCVRETFGALVATWQAAHARDLEVAAVMRRIAVDETRHAALAWEVARWAEPLLSASDRARVVRARARAKRTLERDVHRGFAGNGEAALLGLPFPAEAALLLERLAAALPIG